eukprot:Sspe_Gene.65111::Locus_38556_Transcript_1_1_Confidence_1.000_Length_1877::g.65111::m.65111/K08288/PRKCSH; protein kinase C substrate 80K-H
MAKRKSGAVASPTAVRSPQSPVAPVKQPTSRPLSSLLPVLLLVAVAAGVALCMGLLDGQGDPDLLLGRRTAKERDAHRELVKELRAVYGRHDGIPKATEYAEAIFREEEYSAAEQWEAGLPEQHRQLLKRGGVPALQGLQRAVDEGFEGAVRCGNGVLVSSMVSCDGHCDCCDGADEEGCDGNNKCSGWNTCIKEDAAEAYSLRRQINTTRAALERRAALLDGVVAKYHTFRDEVGRARHFFSKKVEAFRAKVAEGGDEEELRETRYQLQHEADQLSQLTKLSHADFGTSLAFFPLLGECFNYTANERYFRGGCAEPEAHNFTFVICPFKYAYQTRDGEDPILLGSYYGLGTATLTAIDNLNPFVANVHRFQGGAPCYNGPDRVVLLRYQCDVKDTFLREVRENGKCEYEGVIHTPLACTPVDLYRLQHQLRTVLNLPFHDA